MTGTSESKMSGESAWSTTQPTQPGWYWQRQLLAGDGLGGYDFVVDLEGEWQRVAEPQP